MPTVEEVRQALADLSCDTRGCKRVLKKRLRDAKKKQIAQNDEGTQVEQESAEQKSVEQTADEQPMDKQTLIAQEPSKDVHFNTKTQPFDYYLFFDVEATCEENGGFDFPNEIIEFPVVLVSGETFEIVDEYRSYVKPTINPTLSNFCMELTGIDQHTVDNSPTFIDVLDEFQEFMAKWSLFQGKTAVFVTDGPYDIRDFITKQCAHSNLKKRPAYFALPWVNIRSLFKKFYHNQTNKNIAGMLNDLDLDFEGRPHSGLDDAKNLVAIGRKMWQEGCVFKANMYSWDKAGKNRRRRR